METRDDKLLERWCLSADARALEDLFDSAAPRLLKLAIHLVGDPAEAEDLVQATFLAVIEGRERIDASRPALPWLLGVLGHKAADARRRAAREVDPERLLRPAPDDASVPAERRELSGEVAKAIDRLAEPYRGVLVLRLRHGMAIADIAHVRGCSPGTIRVQLHRGLEKLRPLLPASMATALALGMPPMRGLEVIKSAVLKEAAGIAAATSTSWIGAWIVSQKIALIGASACALIAFVAWRANAPEPASIDLSPAPNGVTHLTHSLQPLAEPGREALAAVRGSAEGDAGSEPAGSARVSGVVVDAVTGEPIAGARLELFAPRRAFLLDIVAEHPELYVAQNDGEVMGRARGDWPHLGELSTAARFGREQVMAYDAHGPDAKPMTTTSSGDDGEFELASPEAGGVLVCTHPSYGRRIRAAHDPVRRWTVRMWKERELTGNVLWPSSSEPDGPLTLVFSALRAPVAPHGSLASRTPTSEDLELETLGLWKTTTDASGAFRARVAADTVSVHVLDPGWRIQMPSIFSVDRPARVIVVPVPVLRFADASSGAPVERVHLMGRELRNRYVRWSGEFFAPRGVLTVPGGAYLFQAHADDTLEFSAWSEGYAATKFTLKDFSGGGTTEVLLERGTVPTIAGVVRRGAIASAGAEVALLGRSPLQWRPDENTLVEAVRTGGSGGFELGAAPGTYILRVREGALTYFEEVRLPARGELDIDLDHTARIEIEVVDTRGVPRAEHVVVLSGTDGRSFFQKTGADGRTVFDALSPGAFEVMTPYVSTEASFTPDGLEAVDLQRGEVVPVRFEVPVLSGPRHARVVVSGVEDYSGWRARYDSRAWESLRADGTVPMDLATNDYRLEISAPDDRRWALSIPKHAEDGYEIHLTAGPAGYRGVLYGAGGSPLAGVRVFAFSTAEDGVNASCVTDAGGGFELTGLAPSLYSLQFREDPERVSWHDEDSIYKGMRFQPSEPASADAWLEIRLATPPSSVRVHGIVKRESDGSPFAGALLFVACNEPTDFGGLTRGTDVGIVHTGDDGRFELLVPRTSERVFRVFSMERGSEAILTKSVQDAGLEEEPPVELIVQ